jgi:Virulence-associated protein E-like domain/Bifunctional DNA primase/polymerase, N-terminal
MHAPGDQWATPQVVDAGPRTRGNHYYAEKCASVGFHMFPCKPDKKPCRGVKWRAMSTTDTKQIASWWTKWPKALPAIDLAKSGHLVVDGDRHGGPDGVTAVEQMFAEHGASLNEIPTVVTPANGRHHYFKQSVDREPLGNSDKTVVKRGINVRGHGGYVIAPGAQLPDGRKYTRDQNTPNIFEAARKGAIPLLPQWLIEILQPNGQDVSEENDVSSPAGEPTNDKRGTAYAAATLQALARELATTQPGSRNSKANDAAFRMGTLAGWVTWCAVQSALFDACAANGLVKADGAHAVRATLKSGWNGGLAKPAKDLEDRPRDNVVSFTKAKEKQTVDQQSEQQFQLRFPDTTKGGGLSPTCANALVAILALGVECRYDLFHDRLMVGGHVIAQYAGELSDNACLALRRIIRERFGFDPGRNHTFDAAVQLCLENAFDPIGDYLDALRWDGVKRIDVWLSKYLGADDTPLNREIGRLVLVAMVRRARDPGCKFDQIIVLEGVEGTLKSTALSVLAGSDENFSDQTLLGLTDKEQQEMLRGRWVFEIADLSGMRKAETDHIKAFASRTHDRARRAYDRAPTQQPRRCVIFATTNEETYLKSQTGNRRFWPVRTDSIDIKALRRDRDQLLAEAATVEATGLSLVLPGSLWPDARTAQEERMEYDPWLDLLADVQGTIFATPDGKGEEERVSTEELLTVYLKIPPDKQTPNFIGRLKPIMRRLGWRGPEPMRLGAGRSAPPKRGYRRLQVKYEDGKYDV